MNKEQIQYLTVSLMQSSKTTTLFRFVEILTATSENFTTMEARSQGLIVSSSVGCDDVVTCHNAIVDKDGDLVNVGEFLAYQSDYDNTVK